MIWHLLSFIESNRVAMTLLTILLAVLGLNNPKLFILPALISWLLAVAGYGLHYLMENRH